MTKHITPAEINAYAKNAIIAFCATDCSVAQACRQTTKWDKDQILGKLGVALIGTIPKRKADRDAAAFALYDTVHAIWDEMLFIAMSETV